MSNEYIQRISTHVFLGRSNNEIQNDPDYQTALPVIQGIYRDVWRWHGTGRYQYLPPHYHAVIDVLASIGVAGGLIPHYDPLDYVKGPMHSVSTSPSRLYASLYAQPHYEKGGRIRYSWATAAGWMFYLKEIVKKDNRLLKGKFRTEHGLRGQPVAYFHKKYTRQPVQDRTLFLGGLSDIPGNYPLLIGIRENAFEEAHIADVLRTHESRSKTPIPYHLFTHLEAPLNYRTEVKEKLAECSIDLPIIPIEWGDEYSKTLPLSWVLNGE